MRKLLHILFGALLILPAILPEDVFAVQAETQSDEKLERSIGKIVRLANKARSYEENGMHAFWGDGEVWTLFFEEYEKNVKNLPIESRVEYFWFGMWFLKLGAGPSEQFTELVSRECPEEYSRKLKHFISRHKELWGEDKDKKIYFTEKILGAIEANTNRRKGDNSAPNTAAQ